MTDNFGERLKQILHDKKMTQRELAKASGNYESHISDYILNKREPKATTVIRLANSLGVTTDELLGVKEKKMTNREWLNSLSDKEYVKRLEHNQCSMCIYRRRSKDDNLCFYCGAPESKSCVQGKIEWLKAEHEEEEK